MANARTLDDRVANGDSDVTSNAAFGFSGRYCICTANVASQWTIMHLILSSLSLDRHFNPPGSNALGTCAFLGSEKVTCRPSHRCIDLTCSKIFNCVSHVPYIGLERFPPSTLTAAPFQYSNSQRMVSGKGKCRRNYEESSLAIYCWPSSIKP